MAPYLLLGFLFSGIISVFIDDSLVYKQIGQKKFSSVLKSTLMGIPLPLCSCGVIPVAATLKDYGASKGATTSFLVSTPQTGLDSIFLTYGMLGPVFAIFRPIAAFISGLFCGLIVNSIDDEEHIHQNAENQLKKNNATLIQRFKSGLEYGFLTLPKDIVVPLFQGLLIAACIGFFVPPDFIASYVSANAFLEYFIMLLVSLPLYVCATASIPIAVVLFMKGISPGAVFVFLMAGPATNASSIAVIGNIMGKKILYVYLLLIAITAVFFGFIFDIFFHVDQSVLSKHIHQHEHENPFYILITVLFGFIMANAYYLKLRKHNSSMKISEVSEKNYSDSLDLIVNGMTCSHCKESVESSIKSLSANAETSIDLSSGKVLIRGFGLDEVAIREKIESRGFTVES
tara:strand:+ start:280 stop:1482 length:1203 start_codon:yes stop_codon:yes gene_type:complete